MILSSLYHGFVPEFSGTTVLSNCFHQLTCEATNLHEEVKKQNMKSVTPPGFAIVLYKVQ